MKDFEFNPNGNGSRHAPKNLPDLSVESVKPELSKKIGWGF